MSDGPPRQVPGSAPFTSPGNPGPGRQTRRTPTATPGPRGALPGSVPRGATRTDLDAARLALNEITDRVPEPARPIADSDARQLGIPEGTDVEPPGALVDLSRSAWVQGVVNDASDDELLAIGALDDAGYSFNSTASSLSSVASTPAKAGRHGDTSREYDDGFSRHAGAALNDAVIAGRFDDDDTSSTLTDQSDLFADFLGGIDDTDDTWLDAYYDSERRQLAGGKPHIPDESLADLQRTAQTIDRAVQIDAAAREQAGDVPAAESTKDLTEARAAIALQLKQDKGLRKLIESKTVKLDDILDDNGQPDLQKLNRLRDMIRDETSRASESYVKAATVQRSAPQPIEGYNPTVPGYRRVNGTKYFVWQPARYADSVPS
jgi:hypothetical protein